MPPRPTNPRPTPDGEPDELVHLVDLDPGDEEAVAAATRLRYRWRTEEGGPAELDEATFTRRYPGWLHEHRGSHLGILARTGEPGVDLAVDTTVGVGWLAVVDRVPGPDRWDRRSGFVQALYVVPEARGAGLGAALIDALLDRATRLGLQYVLVNPSARSEPLYRRAGFGGIDHPLCHRLAAPNPLA